MALDKFQPYLFVSAGEQSNKYLTPTITNGIAQFQAQREQSLTGLTVRIDPIQEGTGDPSPTNIRPISGRTGMTVTRAGKNIAKPIENTSSLAGVAWTVTDDGKVTAVGTPTATSQVNFNLVNDVLQLPKNVPLIISGSTAQLAVRVCYRTIDAPTTTVTLATSYDGEDATGIIPDNARDSWVRVVNRVSIGTAVNAECYPMVRISGNAGYEPYTAQEYPISWQTEAGTVYGGTLDVVSGVLTVDRAGYVLNDVSKIVNATAAGSSNFRVRMEFPTDLMPVNLYQICTVATFTSNVGEVGRNFGGNRFKVHTNGYIYLYLDGYNTLEDTKTFAQSMIDADTPITFVWGLQTPQTYQLTPIEVRTIAGYNQIYSDAGPVIDIKF